MHLPAAQHVHGGVDGGAPEIGGRQRHVLDVSTPCQDAQEDGVQDVLGIGRIPGDPQGRAEYRFVVGWYSSANPACGVVEVIKVSQLGVSPGWLWAPRQPHQL